MTAPISQTSVWKSLAQHAAVLAHSEMRDLFAADAKRWQALHLEVGGWLLDYSRQRVTTKTLGLLRERAAEAKLTDRIAAMFRGDAINLTENRAVLHTALRSEFAGDLAVRKEVRESRELLDRFVAGVRNGEERGATGLPFKHVINIGIGGSDLGPLLVCDALRHEW